MWAHSFWITSRSWAWVLASRISWIRSRSFSKDEDATILGAKPGSGEGFNPLAGSVWPFCTGLPCTKFLRAWVPPLP